MSEETEREEEEAGTGRTMDQELKAISAILRQLRDLSTPAQARVVAYIASRFREGE